MTDYFIRADQEFSGGRVTWHEKLLFEPLVFFLIISPPFDQTFSLTKGCSQNLRL